MLGGGKRRQGRAQVVQPSRILPTGGHPVGFSISGCGFRIFSVYCGSLKGGWGLAAQRLHRFFNSVASEFLDAGLVQSSPILASFANYGLSVVWSIHQDASSANGSRWWLRTASRGRAHNSW